MQTTFVSSRVFGLLFAITFFFTGHVQAQLEPMEPAPPQPFEPSAPSGPTAPDAPTQPGYMAEGSTTTAADPSFDASGNWGDPSDHQRVIGELAVAYFGVMGVPVHDGKPNSKQLVDAPTLGIRYWFNGGLGLDAGLGLGLKSTGGTDLVDSTETDKPGGSVFGLGLHVGLPISVWDTAHYNALLIPEVNFGFATGSNDGTMESTADDVSLSGLLFQFGLRAGAEFHLDFLNLPQASVQVTVGLGLAMESRHFEDRAATAGETLSALRLNTNLVSLGSALASGIQVFFYL